MSSKFGTLVEPVDVPSPSRDLSTRCLEDQLLRFHNFRIHARPKGQEAVWEKGGVLFRHGEAMLRIQGLKGGL